MPAAAPAARGRLTLHSPCSQQGPSHQIQFGPGSPAGGTGRTPLSPRAINWCGLVSRAAGRQGHGLQGNEMRPAAAWPEERAPGSPGLETLPPPPTPAPLGDPMALPVCGVTLPPGMRAMDVGGTGGHHDRAAPGLEGGGWGLCSAPAVPRMSPETKGPRRPRGIHSLSRSGHAGPGTWRGPRGTAGDL